jgi:hypothetical protein
MTVNCLFTGVVHSQQILEFKALLLVLLRPFLHLQYTHYMYFSVHSSTCSTHYMYFSVHSSTCSTHYMNFSIHSSISLHIICMSIFASFLQVPYTSHVLQHLFLHLKYILHVLFPLFFSLIPLSAVHITCTVLLYFFIHSLTTTYNTHYVYFSISSFTSVYISVIPLPQVHITCTFQSTTTLSGLINPPCIHPQTVHITSISPSLAVLHTADFFLCDVPARVHMQYMVYII